MIQDRLSDHISSDDCELTEFERVLKDEVNSYYKMAIIQIHPSNINQKSQVQNGKEQIG